MANLASIKNALQIFKTTNATKWAPKTNLKNATVYFEKKTFNDGSYKIVKHVNRNDGQKLEGIFYPDGSLSSVQQKTNKGLIETAFGGTPYNKTTRIWTDNGEYIARLGHKGQPQRYFDAYQGQDGIQRQGKFNETFNRMKEEVQGAKTPEWIQKILEQCKF